MMSDTKGVCTFDTVVAAVQNASGDYTPRNRERYINLAVEAYMDMNMFHIGAVTTKKYKPNQAGIIDLPIDYIDYSKVGVDIGGRIVTLSQNRDIVLHTTEQCGIQLSEATENCQSDKTFSNFVSVYGLTPFGNYVAGSYFPVLYGATGGITQGYFRIDRKRRQLHLDPVCSRYDVIIEYFTTGIDACDVTYIPRQCVTTLKNYVLWQVALNGADPAGKVQMLENLYTGAMLALMESYMPPLSEFYDALLEGYKQTVKR